MLIRRIHAAPRRGTIAIKLAIMLPLLMFLAVIGVDYARIFSRTMILATASRNACVYASQDPGKAVDTVGIQTIAQKDLTDISQVPVVASLVFVGADGFQYVKVTVSMTFSTVTDFPGVPSQTHLARSTTMRVCPTTPKPGTY